MRFGQSGDTKSMEAGETEKESDGDIPEQKKVGRFHARHVSWGGVTHKWCLHWRNGGAYSKEEGHVEVRAKCKREGVQEYSAQGQDDIF